MTHHADEQDTTPDEAEATGEYTKEKGTNVSILPFHHDRSLINDSSTTCNETAREEIR